MRTEIVTRVSFIVPNSLVPRYTIMLKYRDTVTCNQPQLLFTCCRDSYSLISLTSHRRSCSSDS